MKTVQQIIERHGGIEALKQKYINLENPPYMRLAIELIDTLACARQIISVTHWGEQNGDAMRDPDMIFLIIATATSHWEFRPLTFRNDYQGYDREFAIVEDGVFQITDHRQYNHAREFADLWDRNLRDQKFLDRCPPDSDDAPPKNPPIPVSPSPKGSKMKQRFNPLGPASAAPRTPNESHTSGPVGPSKNKKPKRNRVERASKAKPAITPQEALNRAMASVSLANYPAIIEGFQARGIPAADIKPRENVFTYNAWKALGRIVRRGEKSLPILTWINRGGEEKLDLDSGELTVPHAKRFPWTAHVFHISQTEIVPALRTKCICSITNSIPDVPLQTNVPDRAVTNWRAKLRL